MNLTLNGTPIIVDDIAAREIVQRHLINGEQAVRPIALPGTAHLPQLSKDEIYIGSCCGPEGKLVHSILLPQKKDKLNFGSALAWSRGQLPLDARGNFTSDAPNRIEALMLFLHHRALFKKDDVLWTNEQFADDSDFAWLQGFGYGGQSTWHKDGKRMARAVRRVSI